MNKEDRLKEIVKKAQNGDRQSYSCIVDEYKDRVYGLALSITKDSTQAQELAQRVFVKLFSKINKFKFRASFETWLFRVAHNTIMDYCRSKSRKSKKFMPVDSFFHLADGNDPVDSMEKQEIKDRVFQALETLPQKLRLVVIYYHFEDMDYNKISKVIKKPVGTVRSRLYRGRKRLEKELGNFFKGLNV